MGLRLSLSKAYTIGYRSISRLECRTPVSIEQLRANLQQKSIRSQKQSETKLDGSLKYYGASLKYSPANVKILISCLQTMERRMEYTLEEDIAKHKTKIKDLL